MSLHEITEQTDRVPALSAQDRVVYSACLCAAITLIAVGILVIAAPSASLAAVGMRGGYVMVGCGVGVALLNSFLLSRKQPTPFRVPVLNGAVPQERVVTRRICCADRFMHGPQDQRNPLWDTVANISMLRPSMGAFVTIRPYPNQLPYLKTPFNGEMPEGALSILWCGHASFVLKTPHSTLLTDPNWEETIPFMGPIPLYHRSVGPPCRREEVPTINTILLSHTHADHFNVDTLTYFNQRDQAAIYCPLKADSLLTGLNPVTPLTWWQSVVLPTGEEITFLPSDHASQTSALNCNEFLWGGYKIKIPLDDDGYYTIWFTGDSACNVNPGLKGYDPTHAAFDHQIFSGISQIFAEDKIDLVLFQIDPTSHGQDCQQELSHWNWAQGLDLLHHYFTPHFKPETRIIPMHWGTWSFNGDGRDLLAPIRVYDEALKRYPDLQRRFTPMKVGETRVLV